MTEQAGSRPVRLEGTPYDVVMAVWSAVLAEEPIDQNVGFFDLGATSADVLSAVEMLRCRWPDLRVVDIFLHPTVHALAAFLGDDPRPNP